MANFTLWSRENLERLAAELYDENTQLRADLRAALDAFRALVREQGKEHLA
ncbi:hypothetical protein [Acidovorax sp.]|uniref:hypothetical protein n=1 Tax=Acidovorax sp. TaxID=1872122 RepID=UPI0025BD8C1C|nr:hypothetical protein [Acidovorax sp.]MBW8463689.1 hypothetical protein [Acidovorax sp.]